MNPVLMHTGLGHFRFWGCLVQSCMIFVTLALAATTSEGSAVGVTGTGTGGEWLCMTSSGTSCLVVPQKQQSLIVHATIMDCMAEQHCGRLKSHKGKAVMVSRVHSTEVCHCRSFPEEPQGVFARVVTRAGASKAISRLQPPGVPSSNAANFSSVYKHCR